MFNIVQARQDCDVQQNNGSFHITGSSLRAKAEKWGLAGERLLSESRRRLVLGSQAMHDCDVQQKLER